MRGYVLRMDSQVWEPRVFNGYEDISKAIGGYIEAVPVSDEFTVYCHEEGKLLNLTPTALWIDPDKGDILDVLCGPIVLLGPVDDNGDDTDLTPKQYQEAIDHLVSIALKMRDQVEVPEPRMTIISFGPEGMDR